MSYRAIARELNRLNIKRAEVANGTTVTVKEALALPLSRAA
jgi:hypothetical protein